MKPVSGHQLYLMLRASLDHLQALLFGHGQRLFAEHMDAGCGGAHGEVPVHRILKRNINRIDCAAMQAGFVLIIRIGLGNLILARKFLQFDRVARDQGDQFGVLPRMGESGQHSVLRDVPQTHHRVSNFGFPGRSRSEFPVCLHCADDPGSGAEWTHRGRLALGRASGSGFDGDLV